MQNLRIGSIVTAIYQSPNGSGGWNQSIDNGMQVTNLTDSYIEYASQSGAVTVMPWSAVLKVIVTTA